MMEMIYELYEGMEARRCERRERGTLGEAGPARPPGEAVLTEGTSMKRKKKERARDQEGAS